MTLLYIGADDITHFAVKIRHWNITEWDDELTIICHTGSMERRLEWYGIVTSDRFREPSELQVVIVNDEGHRSTPHILREQLGEF